MMRLLFMFLLGLSSAMAQEDNGKWISRAEKYLNGHQQWHAEFTQHQHAEPTKRGEIWVSRPGMLRVDYHAPEKEHLYINSGWATYTVPRFHEVTNIPLDTTPAGFFLKDKISLTQGVQVQGVSLNENEVVFRLVETKDPHKGRVLLIFAKDPFHLKSWVVVDSVQNVTHIRLKGCPKPHNKPQSWFVEKTSTSKLKLRD